MSHDEVFELLAPLALDALDADVRSRVEAHIETCPDCQRELDELLEVATALGTSVEPPPADLWAKIAGQLYEGERRDVTALPPLLNDLPSSETRRARRLVRRARIIVGATLLAAAAAIIPLAINLSSESGRVSNLQSALETSAVHQALATPGHRLVKLGGNGNTVLATFVVLQNGTGYLVSSKMAPLPAGETYQLWGIVAGKPVSIGVMGSHPRQVAFTLASSPGPSKLGVTVEPAGGSLTPSTPMVASGDV
ncbi:MAG TPA: anti-sigma factor [Acidimicrobiales bacterium]|jgi:anti-sigma-K factor RskA|nr:anti-sigma factor [Acidimicrobiales bacterium]